MTFSFVIGIGKQNYYRKYIPPQNKVGILIPKTFVEYLKLKRKQAKNSYKKHLKIYIIIIWGSKGPQALCRS